MEYEAKVILITGACGFIASNVLNYLSNKYNTITFINVDRLDYCSSLKNIDVINKNYHFYKCDITNATMISHILNTHNVDTLIHFAAQTHVDNSFGNSIQFTKDNVLGTHTLLECCKEYNKIKRFIHISTDEVYGEVELDGDECHETTILKPTNPYAATKASAEHLVFSYYYSFKLPIIITRGNNVYGPRQYPEKLIPKCIISIKEGKPFTVHGLGNTVRNFIHVDDVCSAVDIIINKGSLGEVYNIGGDHDNEYSVMEVAKKLIKLIKNSEEYQDYIEYIEDRPFNDTRYFISNDKLNQSINLN